MKTLFVIIILGIICICVLSVIFFIAYDEKMGNVLDVIKHGGDDDSPF